jgi:hyperosmotically inducible periplasmic protein
MFRALLRLVVVVIVLVVAAAFFFGYRWADFSGSGASEPVIGTSGSPERPSERAREAGARLGEQVARGAERASAALEEGRLTAKVKSKIALDDTLDGTSVSVDTAGNVVTLTGEVSTQAQHQRVLQLASETEGVSRVIDHVKVR